MKRVYQYQDVKTGQKGQPFVLCDEHKKTYNPPAIKWGESILIKLGDNATSDCEFCRK